jgi:hypothetical protein
VVGLKYKNKSYLKDGQVISEMVIDNLSSEELVYYNKVTLEEKEISLSNSYKNSPSELKEVKRAIQGIEDYHETLVRAT